MKAVSFRLSESDVDQLKELAGKLGCSRTDAIRFAIQKALGSDTGNSADSAGESAVLALTKQLDVKDEQIAALNRSLEAAHETAKAAQVLHAQERKALESAEQKKSRWHRLVDAWHG